MKTRLAFRPGDPPPPKPQSKANMPKILPLLSLTAVVLGAALAATDRTDDEDATVSRREAGPDRSTAGNGRKSVRLATVTTIQTGGLLDALVADFEEKAGYRVEVYAGKDVYPRARAGKADVVFSHLGHRDARAFLLEGLGEWPQAVLSNTQGFIVPPGDPARVATATDPVQAFGRIARSKSPFVVNDIEGVKYLTETLWHAAGRPDKTGWYFDRGLGKSEAMDAAAKMNAYSIWGVSPFLEYREANDVALRPIVLNDSLMQRLMASVAVNPAKLPGVSVDGVRAFQAYLLDPATQAMIRAFRVPGVPQPLFWPQGRTNASEVLPHSPAIRGKGKGGGKGTGGGKG